MFVADEARVGVGFPVARARLEVLARSDALARVSRDAYSGAPGVSRLVSVTFVDLAVRADSVILGVRWNAAGPDGVPFPALDANITLTADGGQATVLRLEGACRLPDAAPGPQPAAVIMNRAAMATVHSFVGRLADAIACPAGADQF
ncbi:MAG TPA: hypothetical protein VGI74_07470 [Streptosporangiaceae bacterium]|jgi:hypothetical protein